MKLLFLVVSLATPSLRAADSDIKLSILRIENKRYEKYQSKEGSVYLPTMGFIFQDRTAQAICDVHVKAAQDVLVLRENVELSAEAKKHTKEINLLISRCKSGKIANASRTTGGSRRNRGRSRVTLTPATPPADAIEQQDSKPRWKLNYSSNPEEEE